LDSLIPFLAHWGKSFSWDPGSGGSSLFLITLISRDIHFEHIFMNNPLASDPIRDAAIADRSRIALPRIRCASSHTCHEQFGEDESHSIGMKYTDAHYTLTPLPLIPVMAQALSPVKGLSK
jgi:hypothetical protein